MRPQRSCPAPPRCVAVFTQGDRDRQREMEKLCLSPHRLRHLGWHPAWDIWSTALFSQNRSHCPSLGAFVFMTYVCVETINLGACLGVGVWAPGSRGKGLPQLCVGRGKEAALPWPIPSPFLPAGVHRPAEPWHLVLLCEVRKEISQLSSN